MKTTFEEKYTAWIDGELKGEELTSFEAELARTEDADLQKGRGASTWGFAA